LIYHLLELMVLFDTFRQNLHEHGYVAAEQVGASGRARKKSQKDRQGDYFLNSSLLLRVVAKFR
jgi:hypothetical protein